MPTVPRRPPVPESFALADVELRAELVEEVAESVDTIVWAAALDGRILYLNSAVERLTGFPAQVFLDDLEAWWARVHPDDSARVLAASATTLERGWYRERYRFRHRNGDYRVFEVSGRVARDEAGTPRHVVGVTADVTTRVQRDEALRAALDEAETYRNLFWNAGVLAMMADLGGTFTLVSPAWRSVLGYEPDRLLGRAFLDLVHPDEAASARAALDGLATHGGEAAAIELRYRCYDGSYRWLLWTLSADLEAGHLYGIAKDVTERKVAELLASEAAAQLREREARLREAQRLAQLGAWRLDLATGAMQWDEELFRMHGLDPSGPAPDVEAMASLLTPDSRQRLAEAQQTALAGRPTPEIEIEVIRPDGSHGWIVSRAEQERDGEGRLVALRGTAQDITARKRAELAVREREQQLFDMTSEVPEVIYQFRLAPDGAIAFPFMSEGLRRLFEIAPEDVYANPGLIWDVVDPAVLDDFRASIARSAQTLEPWTFEFHVLLASGTRRRVLGASRPRREADGGVLWSGLLRDVTAQRAQERELVEAREAALDASREKSRFLANMSHEIRTPMNGILGMAELALDSPLTGEQREYLEVIRTSGQTLLALLNDILDLSKVEARRVSIEHVPFTLRAVVDEAVRLILPRADEKRLDVSVDVDASLPVRVVGDPLRVGQILRNFLSNAVKFTDAGSVSLRVAPAGGDGLVRLSVTDTGIGIAPEQQDRIFEPFLQSDSSMARRYGGTGLGLSIARQLAGLMGGRIEVDSAPGVGSTFHLDVPLPEAAADATAVTAPAPAEVPPPATFEPLGLRVLVVEDNVINARVVTRMLQKLGCAVDGADTGPAALAALERDGFDAVLMDVQMPGMDGLEVTRRLRVRETATGTHVPVVALTANAMKGDEQACLDAGMDGYLAKPIAVERLYDVLRRVATTQTAA